MGRSQVVVVTGASAGVGRATVRAFAEQEARLGLIARGRDGLEAARQEATALGSRALVVPTDVADDEAVERAAQAVEDELGPIDVWVNNAMTSVFAPFVDVSAQEFRRVTEVTYLGYVFGTRAALARMLPRDRGVIVQVGSALAYRAIPLQSAYCGAKHAIKGFTQSLRTELLHRGSRVAVTMVQLPAVNTPQFDWVLSRLPRRAKPAGPIYQPELMARAIVHASRHPRREMWSGGTTVATLVANHVVPGLFDRYLARTGFDAQQSDERDDHQRPFNLWEPVGGDHGARGRFDAQAHTHSPQVWANTHRGLVAAGVFAAAAGLLLRRH